MKIIQSLIDNLSSLESNLDNIASGAIKENSSEIVTLVKRQLSHGKNSNDEPLTFTDGEDADSLGLDGTEHFDIPSSGDLEPLTQIEITARKLDGTTVTFPATVRLDTPVDVEYYRNGGILQTVLRKLASE